MLSVSQLGAQLCESSSQIVLPVSRKTLVDFSYIMVVSGHFLRMGISYGKAGRGLLPSSYLARRQY